jgi:hypothetical protein
VIATAERQGRYWVDVARAYHQWGKPEGCYRALLAAERAAPAEVRYRPPVHRMTKRNGRPSAGVGPGEGRAYAASIYGRPFGQIFGITANARA